MVFAVSPLNLTALDLAIHARVGVTETTGNPDQTMTAFLFTSSGTSRMNPILLTTNEPTLSFVSVLSISGQELLHCLVYEEDYARNKLRELRHRPRFSIKQFVSLWKMRYAS
ncbi:PREDICTED: uncharacterized protein LOC105558178 [Vollenhovia emeryi]|uniref:uncharacterized protein LOC105558178 n=1 Tax=Vollenhovia emeryi TaxID=411798 RepID=UPI0005F3907A|nr:PREDICTED: uncharacterized protein LOC105558178 [Vollenhovia emeryi]